MNLHVILYITKTSHQMLGRLFKDLKATHIMYSNSLTHFKAREAIEG